MTDKPSGNKKNLPHYVCPEPFHAELKGDTDQEAAFASLIESPGKLIWWKFKQHKLALFSAYIIAFFYILVVLAEFISPYNLHTRHNNYIYAPPQSVRIFHEGQLTFPFVYDYKQVLNEETWSRDYVIDKSKPMPIRFFCSGDSYKFWGIIPSNNHIFCSSKDGVLFLLGTDRKGRDVLSRIIYGARISLTIGLIGIFISFVLALIIGGLAGYYGGWVDLIVQRLIEIFRSLPELPLWMALSAALPVTWSPILVFFGLTIILGLLDWPGLARAIRSKLLSLRQEDYALASELMGGSPKRVIRKHLLPNFSSHIIASLTLSVPSMILGETALSFLGLGLRPPITSWGVLLNEAQKIDEIVLHPWLLFPVVPVVIVVLAFNFLGDGLRDAADPYK